MFKFRYGRLNPEDTQQRMTHKCSSILERDIIILSRATHVSLATEPDGHKVRAYNYRTFFVSIFRPTCTVQQHHPACHFFHSGNMIDFFLFPALLSQTHPAVTPVDPRVNSHQTRATKWTSETEREASCPFSSFVIAYAFIML